MFYLVSPLLGVYMYRRRNGSLVYLNIASFYVPAIISFAITMVSSYSVFIVGCAIGLLNMYFSQATLWQYSDKLTGYTNKDMLDELLASAKENRLKYHSALVFHIDIGDMAFADVIRRVIPENKAIVHIKKGEFVLFSVNRKQSYLDILANRIFPEVQQIEENKPDMKMNLRVETWVEGKDEDAVSFINSLKEIA